MSPIPAIPRFAGYAIGALGAAGILAFGVGYTVAKVRAVYQDGYRAGGNQARLDYAAAAEAQRKASEARAAEREKEIADRLAAAGREIAEADRRAAAALAKLKRQEPIYETCDALAWPDELRRVRPPDGLRDVP